MTNQPAPQRPGYDNALHPLLVSRIIRSTTNEDDLVADPFLGSGTTPVACLQTRRRCYAGDLNPRSLSFTMARILAEVLPAMWAVDDQLTLFDTSDPSDR